MTDCSDKSDTKSVETRISVDTQRNRGDNGPPIISHYNNTIIESAENNIKSTVDKENTVKSEKIHINNTNIHSPLLHELLSKIQQNVNQLKMTNISMESQISKDLEQIDGLLLNRDKSLPIQSKINNNITAAELQRLQMFLIYILEQLVSLNGAVFNTQAYIEKFIKIPDTDQAKNKGEGNEDEDDIISVEELSWDENDLADEKLKEGITTSIMKEKSPLRKSCEKQTQVKTTETSLISNSPSFNVTFKVNEEVNNNEVSNEDSLKAHNSKSFTQKSNHNENCQNNLENVELTNSFHEIKKKFENLNYTNITTQSLKKDCSSMSNYEEREAKLKNPLDISFKSKMSSKDRCHYEELPDDGVDNSAFLVSSIDSFTNSMSFINIDNNNNKFSEKFRIANTDTSRKPKVVPHLGIDVTAEVMSSKKDSFQVNVTNVKRHFITQSNRNSNYNKLEQYIEVDQGRMISPKTALIESPYINYQKKNRLETKSSSSSSEQILALGKLAERIKKSTEEEIKTNEKSSPIYYYLKEMVDSEKTYIQGLGILTQILYVRIKNANMLSSKNFNILFPPSIHQLYEVHTKFGHQLNEAFENIINLEKAKNSNKLTRKERNCGTVNFGQIFLKNLEKDNWNMFDLYRQYFSRSKLALSTFYKLKNQSPKFDRLIKNLQHNEHCNGLDLGSFLLLPLQRLQRYLMLMRKILYKLPNIEVEERISMMAIEHLLHSFLSEIDTKGSYPNFNKNGTSSEFSNVSMKCASMNDMIPLEFEGKIDGDKFEKFSKILHKKNIKKFYSQSLLLNDKKKSKDFNIHFDVNFESQSHNVNSAKESLDTLKLLDQNNSTHSLNNFNKISETSSSNQNLKLPEMHYNKESNSLYEQRHFSDSHRKVMKILTGKANIPLTDNQPPKIESRKLVPESIPKECDTRSIKSQVTDECSVCLNSQDEFEVDTSIEEDDKTCVGATDLWAPEKNYSNVFRNDTISRIADNSVRFPLIEYCSPDGSSNCQIFKPPQMNQNLRNYPKQIPFNHKSNSILDSILSSEAELIINKKVDNIIKLLCHVVTEIFFNEKERKMAILKNENKPAQSNNWNSKSIIETETNNPTEFCRDEKSTSKRFSIKHLFSMKRRGRLDQEELKTQDCNPISLTRPKSRISLQKKT